MEGGPQVRCGGFGASFPPADGRADRLVTHHRPLDLRGRLRSSAAYAGYQATRYDDTGRMLPTLIRETEAAGGDDLDACSVRALVYDTAAALLHRVGETSLAWTAADRALAAAEQSGRPELVALQAKQPASQDGPASGRVRRVWQVSGSNQR